MEESSFFNDVDGDRVYYAEDFAEYFIPFFTNGIFNNGCQVLGNSNDMAVNVSTGRAFIEGYRYRNKQSKTLIIDNADGVLGRIDNIVIRLDLTNRNITAQVIKGAFSNNPVAPNLTRTSTIYDLRIAKVYIPAGTTEITQELIEDCRFITSDCGNVISPIETPDTEQLFIEIQAIFDKFIADNTNEFDTWFEHVKEQLSIDQAGNLQNQIDGITPDVEQLKTDVIVLQDNILDFELSRTINGDTNIDVYKPKNEKAIESESVRVGNYKLTDIIGNNNAGFHNSIFRGKNVTEYYENGSLYTRISSGKFEDLFVGDYIIKNNITWRIAGFDVYLHKGDIELTKHHAIIVPDKHLTIAQMNNTNTSVGGYVGSEMVKSVLPNVLSTYITPIFGNHVIEYRTVLSNSINAMGYNRLGTNNGCANGWEWYSRKLDLMNEVQLFGSITLSSAGYDIGSDNCQLPLFRLAPEYITNRSYWCWLRAVTMASTFASVSIDGCSDNYSASGVGGVRPYFYID